MGEKFDTPSGVATATPAGAAGSPAGAMPAAYSGGPSMQMPGGDQASGKPRTVDKKGRPVDPPKPFKPTTQPFRAGDIQGDLQKKVQDGRVDPEAKVYLDEPDGPWVETSDGRRGFFTGGRDGIWVDEQGNQLPADWKGRI